MYIERNWIFLFFFLRFFSVTQWWHIEQRKSNAKIAPDFPKKDWKSSEKKKNYNLIDWKSNAKIAPRYPIDWKWDQQFSRYLGIKRKIRWFPRKKKSTANSVNSKRKQAVFTKPKVFEKKKRKSINLEKRGGGGNKIEERAKRKITRFFVFRILKKSFSYGHFNAGMPRI